MSKPFSSIQCPSCEASLVKHGSYITRLHPLANFIRKYRTKIILFLMLIFLPLTLLAFLAFGAASGYIGLAIFFIPFAITHLLERPFKLYRVIVCPFCSFSDKQEMGYNMKVASDKLPNENLLTHLNKELKLETESSKLS